MALKNFTQGMEFPRDFWNYHVNPITGFNTFDTGLTDDEVIKKYELMPNKNVNASETNNYQ